MKKALLAGIVVAAAVLLGGCMVISCEERVGRRPHVVCLPPPHGDTVIIGLPAPAHRPHGHYPRD
jgi:hypothetical protein